MTEEAISASLSGTLEFSEDDYIRIMLKESLFDSAETPDYLDAEALMHELYNLQEREIKQHLHAVTLSDYLRQKIIPRGLRLQKAPALGLDNPEFCKKWCEILNKCSFDLMALIISEISKQVELTRDDFKKAEVKLKELADKKKLSEIKKDLERHRAKCTSEIRSLKKTKFARDTEDYKHNKVYFWRDGKPEPQSTTRENKGKRPDPARRRRHRPYRSGLSSSSFESGSDTGSQWERGATFLGHAPNRPQRPQRWTRILPSTSGAGGGYERKRTATPNTSNTRTR